MATNKSKELPLFDDIFPNTNLYNSYEEQNSWLIEILTVAAENYSYNSLEYEEKTILLKNNPIYGLSRQDLFWMADKFARVFARVKYRYDYKYYHTWFFSVFFGTQKQKIPDKLFWANLNSKRLEKKASERPNPSEPIFFHSGASALSDFKGYTMANKSVGVQINVCSKAVKQLILAYNTCNGRIFVDNGSFSACRKGEQIDFNKVLRDYFELVEKAEKPHLLTLVAPDRVGNQQATLDLLAKYQKELYQLICLGVDLIIPIQLGNLSLAEAYKQIVNIMQTKAFRVGLPSNAKAVTLENILEFVASEQPKKIHLLGLRSTKFNSFLSQITGIAPQTHVSADATTLRSKLKKGSKLVNLIEAKTKQAVDEILCVENNVLSYSSLIYKIFHQPAFLSESQAKYLGKLLTPLEEKQDSIVHIALSGICGFYNGSRLGDLLDKYYEKQVVDQALQQFAQTLAKRAVSGNIRASVISQTQNTSNSPTLISI